MTIKQIDDTLIHEHEAVHNTKVPEPVEQRKAESIETETLSQVEDESEAPGEESEIKTEREEAPKKDSKESKPIEAKAESKESDTDEYGLEIPKPKMYSEEDVQRMIRERLQRGQQATPQQQAVVQKAAENFQADPNSGESWEIQLKDFVKNTLNEVQQEEKTRAWKQEEQTKQAAFESKFSTGMEKFSDFREVVGNMPITDSMLMAIRDMDAPATFIYAAAKLQPKELERIAAIADPFAQAKEMGRLDERMKKAKAVTRAAPPLKAVSSDIITPKTAPKKNIDSLIQNHAKSKLRK